MNIALAKAAVISLMTASIFLSSLTAFGFNAYAQQGGAATGGEATGGEATVGGPNCNVAGACPITQAPRGGDATGGDAEAAREAANYQFVRNGSLYGYFSFAYGVALDSSGNMYVTDMDHVDKFDSNGNFITKWGSNGTGDGQFHYPIGIDVDSSGNLYVVDSENHRIQKFDSNGNFITKWGSNGTGDGQFYYPRGIAVDSSGNVYVAESGASGENDRIQKFDSNGNFITKWGSYGTGDGRFDSIVTDVAIDTMGNVYVTDEIGDVQLFAPTD